MLSEEQEVRRPVSAFDRQTITSSASWHVEVVLSVFLTCLSLFMNTSVFAHLSDSEILP